MTEPTKQTTLHNDREYLEAMAVLERIQDANYHFGLSDNDRETARFYITITDNYKKQHGK